MNLREKSNKLNFLKMKNFCSSEDTVKKIKRQAKAEKKICKTYLIKDLYPEYITNS